MAFSNSAQGSDSPSGQGERRRGGVDRAELLHDLVHNSTGGPACENVGQRGMAGGPPFFSGAVEPTNGGFGAEERSRPRLKPRPAPRPPPPHPPPPPPPPRPQAPGGPLPRHLC